MMNWKGCVRKRSWPKFKAQSQHMSAGTEENHKILSQNSRSPSRDLNPVPPEYEKGVFIMRSRCLLVDTEEKIGAEVHLER
jgi:hypothetical protein